MGLGALRGPLHRNARPHLVLCAFGAFSARRGADPSYLRYRHSAHRRDCSYPRLPPPWPAADPSPHGIRSVLYLFRRLLRRQLTVARGRSVRNIYWQHSHGHSPSHESHLLPALRLLYSLDRRSRRAKRQLISEPNCAPGLRRRAQIPSLDSSRSSRGKRERCLCPTAVSRGDHIKTAQSRVMA